jgi:hypothetical protein
LMMKHVKGRKLYQVTLTNGYKQAFVPNQKVKVGADYNPFFKFYETTLLYPVKDGDTGEIAQINAVEWLHRVRIKTILTSYEMLAEKAHVVSQHYMILARKILMEQIRLDEFSGEPPSRQRCLYLCESVEEAKAWLPLVGAEGLVCELTCTGKTFRADSRLMVKVSEPLSVTRDNARAYWKGEVSADPRMETLFEGDAVVSAIGL